jgi:ABC-type phosphate transport system ATPase subunit
MAQALPFIYAGATLLSAGGQVSAANAQAGQLKREAVQYEAQASLDRASSQRKAMEEVRQGKLAESRVRALVAASGAGASDPSVINALANMASEAEYAKDVAIYEGEVSARGNERTAEARRAEAKTAKRAGIFNAAGTVLNGALSMYDRFGGKKA